jgi:hypothetical protein
VVTVADSLSKLGADMSKKPMYHQMTFTSWIRVLTANLESEGIKSGELYPIAQYLDQSGLRHNMASIKIQSKQGRLIGLMNGEFEEFKCEEEADPVK